MKRLRPAWQRSVALNWLQRGSGEHGQAMLTAAIDCPLSHVKRVDIGAGSLVAGCQAATATRLSALLQQPGASQQCSLFQAA